jgi:tRNA(Arg) A34 adenosine deaminase TadA
MCVGALLQADADSLVYAVPDPAAGATHTLASARLSVVSGILQREAAELRSAAPPAIRTPAARA